MASVGGAIRTTLLSAGITGVSTRIFRDIAPPETTYPFMTISDEVSNQPALIGDQFVLARTRQVRVNLFQIRTSENVEIIDEVVTALDRASINANQIVFRVRVADIVRLFDSEDDIVQHSVTLNVIHKA
jgi:hypothetical protein